MTFYPFSNSGQSFTNPMTTAGDMIDATTGGTAQRLAIGSTGQVLTVSGGAPAWEPSASGFTNPMTTAGDMIDATTGGTAQRLAIGSNGQFMTVSSGAPGWGPLTAGTTSTAGVLQLDGTAGDIQPLGAQAAGASGLSADAKHVHPTTGVLTLQATTTVSGIALINGTQTLLSWVVPSDGAMHRFILVGELVVTSTNTGGTITANFNDPGGASRAPTVLATSQTSGFHGLTGLQWTVAAGQTVTITQSAALTAGGPATFYAEMWGV